MPTFDQLQQRYDNRLPPEDAPEPSEAQFADAFDQLMRDNELLIEYLDAEGPDTLTIFQLIHQYGLPSYTPSERDDNLRDSLTTTANAFIEGYRDWLGERLAERAEQVRLHAIEEARLDAEAAAFDDDDCDF